MNGFYAFELNQMDTKNHAHPCFEILIALEGDFSIAINSNIYENINIIIIPPNVNHRIYNSKGFFNCIMVEFNQITFINNLFPHYKINQDSNIINQTTNINYLAIKGAWELYLKNQLKPFSDNKNFNKILELINSFSSSYEDLFIHLKNNIPLSQSRISHVFKEFSGLSIKKYWIWINLKKSIRNHLYLNMPISNSLYQFFDQAHFIKAFNEFLGISPGKVYNKNSRFLQ